MEEAERLNDDLTRYLANEMGSSERTSFEQRLQTDPQLQRVLDLKRANEGNRQATDATTGTDTGTSQLQSGTPEQRKRPRERLTRVAKIARVAGAFFAIVILVLLGSRGYRYYRLSPDQLYAEAFLPYELPRSIGDTAESRSSIIRFYRHQQFDSVIRRAKKQVILTPPETLLTGVSYLVSDDPFWAISPLRRLSEGKDTQLVAEAHFYLALAYLKNKDYDYALTVIQRIKRSRNHKYAARFPDEMIEKVEMLKWR